MKQKKNKTYETKKKGMFLKLFVFWVRIRSILSLAGLPSNDANDYGQNDNANDGQDQLLFPSFVLKISQK
jgi:hypothetical protein